MIVGATHPEYQKRLQNLQKANQYNGAFYYALEIEKNIIPNVETDRDWILVNAGICTDGAVVFIHDNKTTEQTYGWLKDYKALILVCGIPETKERVRHLGTPIYLPLSVDVEYVRQFSVEKKTKKDAFAGRPSKRAGLRLPLDCATLEGVPRSRLLPMMAQFETVYAVGRTAIEAKALSCEIGVYDPRFPNPDFWRVIDNKEAAQELQKILREIDKEEE